MARKIALLTLIVMAAAVLLTACGTSMDGGDERLVGSWDWNGSPYYRFNEGGGGTMAGSAIRWTTSGNTLEICVTPSACGNRCSAPMSSSFSLSNGDDTLRFMGFTYTRR